MNHVTHPLNSAGISIFSPEMSRFYYVKNYKQRLQTLGFLGEKLSEPQFYKGLTRKASF